MPEKLIMIKRKIEEIENGFFKEMNKEAHVKEDDEIILNMVVMFIFDL